MEEVKQLSIPDLLEALWRRWYLVSIPLLIMLTLGGWLYVVIPRTYEAATLILVQPQEIPRAYVETTVQTGIEERVRTLSQEVMSRSNLETIITDLDLYRAARNEGVSMDVLVASMRRKITVNTSGGARRGQVSSFTIAFRGQDPQMVAEVTNRLAAFFIESNLRLRARQASQTTMFLDKQLKELKQLLQGQEAQVEAYRNRYMGELPEQLQSNISTIAGLQVRLEAVQVSRTDAMNRRLLIQRQLSQIESDQPGASISGRAQRLAALQGELQEARMRYTADHPQVRRLEEQIAEVDRQQDDSIPVRTDPQVIELRTQLSTINIEVDGLRKDMERLKERIAYYQHRVENTPRREQELASLTRDYDITQQNYQRLLDRYYEAKRAEELEKRQQGEQFRVIDFAQPPQIPISPDRTRIALVFLVLGLAIGAGVVVLLEFFDTSIKSVEQLEKNSGDIPCISVVPLALTQEDVRRKSINQAILVFCNVLIAGGGVFLIWYVRAHEVSVNLPLKLPF